MLSPVAIVMVFVALLAAVAFTVRATHHAEPVGDRTPRRDAPVRTWWGNPCAWLLVSAISLAVGLVLAPRLFGGVIVFLPFLWFGRPRIGGHHEHRHRPDRPDREQFDR